VSVPGLMAVLKVALHVPILHRYGYHHDELYFLACGRHLAFGYVDHPPLVPWLALLSDTLFGPWLPGLRLSAMLAGAATVFLTATLARRLGGGRLAQFLAGLAVLVAPVYLRTGNLFCIPAFEPLVWVVAAHLLVTIIAEDRPRYWLWFGLAAGLGLLLKHSTLLLGFGVLVALVATPARRHLRSPWLYAGGAVALLVFLPNLVWQARHGWPTVEFLRALNAQVMTGIPPWLFLVGQVLYLNPVTAPLWLLGLLFFFRPAGRPWRVLGWVYLAVLVVLVFTKSKIYYLAPAYPALLAGGGVALEKWAGPGRARLLGVAGAALLLAGGVLVTPLSLPILSIKDTDRYVRAFTFGAADKVYELTGDLHGMFGWRERVEAIAGVWNDLSQEERGRSAVFSGWYGPAAAVDYFGLAYGLPGAFSGHMSYHLWGPPPRAVDTWLVVSVPERDVAPYFEEISVGADVELEDVNPWEHRFVVLVCRRPKVDLREAWPRLRRWSF
jgi:hypothetical protein